MPRDLEGDIVKFVPVLVAVLGVVAIIAGGADDSPGLQLIGVAIITGAIALGARTIRRSRR